MQRGGSGQAAAGGAHDGREKKNEKCEHEAEQSHDGGEAGFLMARSLGPPRYFVQEKVLGSTASAAACRSGRQFLA